MDFKWKTLSEEEKNVLSDAVDEGDVIKKSKKLLWRGIGLLVVAVIICFGLPYVITHWSWISLDVEKTSEIGDTIGGILGPTIALVAAVLTFLAFFEQYKANLQQKQQFLKAMRDQALVNKKNDRQSFLSSFEDKFYTMLSIHRDNVNAMDINRVQGRKVFLHLMDELRFLYRVIELYYKKHFEEGKFSSDEIYQVAYLSFFFGVGKKSTPLVKDIVNPPLKIFVEAVHKYILKLKPNKFRQGKDYIVVHNGDAVIEWEKIHTLGVGHLRRLSHYIRHLYHIVQFVDSQPNDLLSEKEKYEYVSYLRAQLSTFEQLLLYYNALSVLGEPWRIPVKDAKESYLFKYCIVKSMPINSADFYLSPRKFFVKDHNEQGYPLFEWLEIQKRMAAVSARSHVGKV